MGRRGALAGAYAGAILLIGLMHVAVFDPQGQGCFQCPGNPLLLGRNDTLDARINRWGVRLGLVWTIALIALLGWKLLRSTRSSLVVSAPVRIAAAAYLAVLAWDFRHSLSRGQLGTDPADLRLWRLEAAALTLFALAVGFELLRGRRARASVAQLVVDLGRSPRPGGVRAALATALGDPALELAYPHGDGFVDAAGQPVALEGGFGRAVAPLMREGRQIATLVHDAALLDDPGRAAEVIAGARLAVENERLGAEVRAQLRELRASRVRIIETADSERRRLERDLHDGAQQRLVGLTLGLRMVATQLRAQRNSELESRLAEADTELRAALAELRDLAHGIYPSVLADEGLAAALETLAEHSETPLRLDELPQERLDSAVEAAAYFVVAETLKRSPASRVTVGAVRSNGRLVVTLEGEGAPPDELVDLEDRVGALDGRLLVERSSRLRIRAELPCG